MSAPVDKATLGWSGPQYHLGVSPGEVPKIALLPGDPFRVSLITEQLDDVREVAHAREYRTAVGTYKGIGVTATSTGIGCPSAAIALEELIRCGVTTFVRVGSTAALQPNMAMGDLVVNVGSFRNDGTSRAYVPDAYPAVPDLELTSLLAAAAREHADRAGVGVHVGLNVSDDAFYAEGPDWIARMTGMGLLNVEMESSALFTIGRLRGVRTGMVCAVSGNLVTGDVRYGSGPDPRLVEGWRASVTVALEAVSRLSPP